MHAQALQTPRFLRKTTLGPNEYRKNFRQIDNDVITVITSQEADAITPLMSKIYLRLIKAPDTYFESAGVLRFEEQVREGKRLTAWKILCDLLNVSSSTASKAIKWLAQQGVIGYYAGKNGVGLRIFFNRASASVGVRQAGEKILAFSPAPSSKRPASSDEAGFNGTFHHREILEFNKDSHAPKNGADFKNSGGGHPTRPEDLPNNLLTSSANSTASFQKTRPGELLSAPELLKTLKAELEPAIRAMAAQAAALEHDRTRQWMEQRGLPKVARVAQREAFNVLKQCGAINVRDQRARSELMVGGHKIQRSGPRLLSPAEIEETAEICLWMLESRGQPVQATLAEISAETGGYLLAEDSPKVLELVYSMLGKENRKE